MRIRVVLEFDREAGSFAAYCPELPGCVSCGPSEEAAMAGFREAFALYFDAVEAEPVPPGARVVELNYEFE